MNLLEAIRCTISFTIKRGHTSMRAIIMQSVIYAEVGKELYCKSFTGETSVKSIINILAKDNVMVRVDQESLPDVIDIECTW